MHPHALIDNFIKAMKKIEKLLQIHGFQLDQNMWDYMKYKKTKIPSGNSIIAHFGTDKKLATDFTFAVYEKVFKLSLDDMELMIG